MYRFLLLILCLSTSLLTAQDITIPEAREINADGEMVRLDDAGTVEGIAVGFNFRPGGHTWAVYDTTNQIGLGVFSNSDDLGYTFQAGDHVRITGTLAQFRGLAQIEATAIEVVDEGNPIPEPKVVTVLNEDSESSLVKLENVELVDPTQWGDSGSFNVKVTNGIVVSQIRIDSDTDISGRGAPIGVFSITGIGGQFDTTEPLFEGYQLFPRTSDDIFPYNEEGLDYAPTEISEARRVDADGESIYEDQALELRGLALGINLRPGGLQFALVDDNNVGIGVFSFDDDFGYTVIEGDELTIQGIIDQFNGLTQIEVENVVIESTGNTLPAANVVTALTENTESSLNTILGLDFMDPSEWLGDGSSFNVTLSDGKNEYQMRIDNDTEMANMAIPVSPFNLTGIGGQFDFSSPYLEGYQILPRTPTDIETILNTEELIAKYNISIYPNPTQDIISLRADKAIDNLVLYNILGEKLMQSSTNSIDLSAVQKGNYILRVSIDGDVFVHPVIKID